MYCRLYIAIHGLSGSWPPQVPESPTGVGSRLVNLRGVGVDPRCAVCLLKPAPADRVLDSKNRTSLSVTIKFST